MRQKIFYQHLVFKISPNVVYLKEDSEPKSNTTSILMLIGGILGVLITIGSYFTGDEEEAT